MPCLLYVLYVLTTAGGKKKESPAQESNPGLGSPKAHFRAVGIHVSTPRADHYTSWSMLNVERCQFGDLDGDFSRAISNAAT